MMIYWIELLWLRYLSSGGIKKKNRCEASTPFFQLKRRSGRPTRKPLSFCVSVPFRGHTDSAGNLNSNRTYLTQRRIPRKNIINPALLWNSYELRPPTRYCDIHSFTTRYCGSWYSLSFWNVLPLQLISWKRFNTFWSFFAINHAKSVIKIWSIWCFANCNL